MYLAHHRQAARDRRPAGPLLRLRLHPARPRRLLHRRPAARRRAAHSRRLRPGRRRCRRGGTFLSALTVMSRLPAGAARRARTARAAEPRPAGPLHRTRRSAVRTGVAGAGWLGRAAADDRPAGRRAGRPRRSERYGPDFSYRHYAAVSTCRSRRAACSASARCRRPPSSRRPGAGSPGCWPPGNGPSPERRARSWFSVRFIGDGGGERVVTEVSGGDPGYDETAKMLAESALCLALRRPPGNRGPGDHRDRDGRRPDRPPHQSRPALPHPLSDFTPPWRESSPL